MSESRMQERTHSQTIRERGCPVLSWCLTTGCFHESLEEYSGISVVQQTYWSLGCEIFARAMAQR